MKKMTITINFGCCVHEVSVGEMTELLEHET